MIDYYIKVYGKVQGVGFRRHTKKYAILNEIKGWVCNKEDGTVEIIAQGLHENMNNF